MGTEALNGLRSAAELCSAKAVFLRDALVAVKGVEQIGPAPFFNEFVVRVPGDAADVAGKLIDKGFAGGFPLGRYYPDRRDQLLVAVTEKRTREEMKGMATALEAILWG